MVLDSLASWIGAVVGVFATSISGVIGWNRKKLRSIDKRVERIEIAIFGNPADETDAGHFRETEDRISRLESEVSEIHHTVNRIESKIDLQNGDADLQLKSYERENQGESDK